MKHFLLKVSFIIVTLVMSMQMAAQADPTFTEVNTSTDVLTITNLGDTGIELSNYWVCLGPGTYRQIGNLPLVAGDTNLAPNEDVSFTYDLINESNGGLGLFSTNTFGSS